MSWRLVAILNPEHLLQPAEKLIERRGSGAPRQVDLRRAISSAYYGVFHAILTAAADNFVGRARRSSAQYALAYRSIDHRSLRDLCDEVSRPVVRSRYRPYVPISGFGNDIRAFANSGRYAADYGPALNLTSAEARASIGAARGALGHLQNVPDSERHFPQPSDFSSAITTGERLLACKSKSSAPAMKF
jgi:hypothetical protein